MLILSVKYSSDGISIRPRTILNRTVSCNLLFLVSCESIPTEIVKHVCDIARVPAYVGNKSCGPSLYHFDLVFLIPLVWVSDSTTVIQVRTNHGEVGLGLGFFACLSPVTSKKT